jgi:hypothetical protein
MANRALKHLNLLQAGIRSADLKKIVAKISNYGYPEPLIMMEFAILSNNLESRTQDELGLGMDDLLALWKWLRNIPPCGMSACK